MPGGRSRVGWGNQLLWTGWDEASALNRSDETSVRGGPRFNPLFPKEKRAKQCKSLETRVTMIYQYPKEAMMSGRTYKHGSMVEEVETVWVCQSSREVYLVERVITGVEKCLKCLKTTVSPEYK